jgi:mRNA interferase RelE/StbE
MYKLVWDKEAIDDLKSIDRKKAIDLARKVEKQLTKNSNELGKKLTGRFKGLYRYRYGDYRIIYQIFKKEITIVIVRVGHRKNIYD